MIFFFCFFCPYTEKFPSSCILSSSFLIVLFFFILQSDRLKQVQDHLYTLNSICLVLGMDFKQTVSEIHPSLGDSEGSKIISNEIIEQLAAAIQKLREVKLQRMQRVQNYVTFCFPICLISLSWLIISFALAATRSCNHHVGALELDGYTNRRATDVSERHL